MRIPHHGTPLQYAIPTLKEARAIQALASGEATKEQQRAFYLWLVTGACGAGSEMLSPGQPDVSAYLAGRLSVSLQIGWVSSSPVESFRQSGDIE
jgi:hypothetical protein